MTVLKWFKFGKSLRGDVKMLFLILVSLAVLDNLPLVCKGEDYGRESRKLFGGYRITPTYCKASRAAKYNRGNTICMFNHECTRRGGEVVGACMDGFLFGACCQLKSDSQSHIPKGPGVVMTSYLDYPDSTDSAEYDAEELSAWHNSYKPVVTPGYKPGDKTHVSTLKPEDTLSSDEEQGEIVSGGLSQITNTLLSTPPKESDIVYLKPKPDYYTHSSIDHGGPDTILVHANGTIDNTVVRPSDFNIQLSSMQTKPTRAPTTTVSVPPKTVSTHRPVKPIFRPKPTLSTENYIAVSAVTKNTQKVPELSSINSIIQMLNESTPSMKEDVTPSIDMGETKSSPAPSSVYSSFPSTGHYVTLRPSYLTTHLTKKPSTYLSNKNPSYDYIHTTPNSLPQDDKPSSYYSSPSPSQSTSQAAIDAFNRYPTDPTNFGDLSTFSIVSSSTTPKPKPKPTATRKPPSTSYVTGSAPVRIPPNVYENIDSFSSVTPTIIVLNDIRTTTPPSAADEPQFVEISQEPFKKPVSQITVNNHISSTNNIYVPKPSQNKPMPSSPTVVITPKPGATTPYPIKVSSRPVVVSTRPLPISTSTSYDFIEQYTTIKPEMQTSPDDSINFPPVRNPMLNATGSNVAMYNTHLSLSDNELDELPDLGFTTPIFESDDKLKNKMNVFVSKIVGNLQGTFQELHDIVILGTKPNRTILTTTTQKPKRTQPTTKRPFLTTTKKPLRLTTTTRKPTVKTTRKPVRLTTQARRTTTTTVPTTTTTKKPVTTTKKPPPTRKVTTTTQAVTTTTDLNDEVTTENYVDQPIDYNDKNLCGVRPLSKTGRIVGGKNAKFGSWPWQVLVRESTWLGLFTKNKCGGVLITNRYVTTAAHCQPGFLASLVAVFGENDISGDSEPRKPVSRNVRKVIVHRQYDAATFENDLALLELEAPIKFDAHIVPICMPSDESEFTGRVATVTGWGRLKYGGGVPAVLQEVQVPVIENSACQDMFQTAGHSKKILSSFICAGYANGQKDSCEGDSGGPLVLQRDDGRWQLVGTVSHGIKCAAPFLPGVYMRTTFYKPWLRSITGVH